MQASIKSILQATNNDFTFSGAYTDLEGDVHSYTLYNNATFRQILLQMFSRRTYNDWDEETDLEDLTDDFISSYRVWMASRKDMYMARLYALDIKFNPLENYRSHEERSGEFEHGEKIEVSFDDRKEKITDDTSIERTYTDYKETTTDDTSIERTYTDYKETTKDDSYIEQSWEHDYTETYGHGQQTKTMNVSADDSDQFAPRSQEIDASYNDTKGIEGTIKEQHGQTLNGVTKEITGSTKDEHGYTEGLIRETTGSYKDTHGYTDGLIREQLGKESTQHTGKDTDGYTLDRFGNIGVTTSQQMLASDLDLLKYDITMIAIKEFISQYTYMSAEVD